MLTQKERTQLQLVCDTLAPSLEAEEGDHAILFQTGALTMGSPALVEQAIEQTADPQGKMGIRGFLLALEIAPLNGFMAGQWRAFSQLDLAGRTAVLRAYANSRNGIARQLFQAIKRLTLFITFTLMPDEQPNPSWAGYGYDGPPTPQPDQPRPIRPLEITEPTTLETDVLIIGSGAGGGVVAGELSAAGHDVIVLEKGNYYADTDFTSQELQANEQLYEKAGALTSQDLSMVIIAGSTLGGGTTVNWMASLRTPDNVLHEWADGYGFTDATGPEFQQSLDAVSARINVNTDESIPNPQNAALERGGQALGYEVSIIPRNVKSCEDCTFCQYGCRHGAKQGTQNTYLLDAFQRGARIVVQAHVNKIMHEGGRVVGALATVTRSDGRQHKLRIHAKAVVVAAGAIHTPALLQRSGLKNPHIGANLHLHPVTMALGQYDDPINPWNGPPMTRLINQFTDLDGEGYGYRIEVPPTHPGLFASALPWQSGRQHRRMMARLGHFATFLILTRDYYGGRVKTDKAGQPVIHYQLHPYDANHAMHGLLQALRVHRAAGAKMLYSPHNRLMQHHITDDAGFERYLKQVQKAGLQPNAFALFSAHQMSSCRIAGGDLLGAVKPNGETYEVRQLFVADASVLPTASGVNPMLTIMATAHYIAQHIKASL